MRINAQLAVTGGRVACPASGRLEEVGHCARCANLNELKTAGDIEVVNCSPEVASLAAATENVIRA